jgi:allantoin racemase
MAKILVIVPFALDAEGLQRRRQQLAAVKLDPESEFHYRAVKAGPTSFMSPHDWALMDLAIFEAGCSAQEEGYDAVCIDTMSDSGLGALRSVLDIPVIGPGRASMLAALMLGERFSILIMWDRWRHLYKKPILELGLTWRCASIRSIGVEPSNQSLLAGKEDEVYPLLLDAARRCVEEDGADVILLGSTTMHQAHAYLRERLAVPVINPGPLSYKLAEAALALRLSHSRKAHPRPAFSRLDLVDAMLSAAVAPPRDGS